MTERVLHQFPISHYCEKIRWVLDRKGLPYTVKNQLPGLHRLVNRRLGVRGSVPVLIDGSHVIGNSSDIALYLDDQYPEHRLIPGDPEQRAQVLSLEAYFDQHAGPPVRRWWYSFAVQDLALFERTFFRGSSGMVSLVGRALRGPLAREIGRMYRVGGEGRAEAWRAVEGALARLEELTEGDPERYLVGDTLTLADLTAAALLGPLVGPPELPWTLEIDVPEILSRRDAIARRPAGRWLLQRYAQDRTRSVVV